MEKQYNNEPLLTEETDQLNFDQAEQEVRDLFEREKLPTSSELEKYNELMPNGAERILNIIEEERTHRREMELKELKSRSDFNNLRVIFGFLFGFFFLIFVNASGVGYLLVWAAMVIVLVMIFAPYIKSKLIDKNK